MAKKKKTVGGIKGRNKASRGGLDHPAPGSTPGAPRKATAREKKLAAELQAPVKKTGTIKAKHVEKPRHDKEFLRRAHKGCPAQCLGHRFADGRWIHDLGCPWVVVEWDHDHGRDGTLDVYVGHWPCRYPCKPLRMPGGWTHQWDCPFWDNGDWRQIYPTFPEKGPTPF